MFLGLKRPQCSTHGRSKDLLNLKFTWWTKLDIGTTTTMGMISWCISTCMPAFWLHLFEKRVHVYFHVTFKQQAHFNTTFHKYVGNMWWYPGPEPASQSRVGKFCTFLIFTSNFDWFFLFFLKLFSFFPLILGFRVSKQPTREGSGYATGNVRSNLDWHG